MGLKMLPCDLRAEAYLDKLIEERWIDDRTKRLTLDTINGIEVHTTLRFPDIAPTESGRIILSWDEGDRHLECEIRRDGIREWFYRNRETNVMRDEDIDGASPTEWYPTFRAFS